MREKKEKKVKKAGASRLRFWRSPRFRYGALSTALLALFLAILVVLNMAATALEKKNAWRVDFSFNALTTYGEKTEEVLATLEHPVHIYALYTRGQEDQPLLELLDRYAAASDKVTWEQTDISLDPGLLTKFRSETSSESLTNDSIVVSCEETGRWKLISAVDLISLSYDADQGVYEYAGLTYESSLTSAIRYVAQDTIPRVMILQGHGELDEDGTQVLAQLLAGNDLDVYYFTLSTTETELSPDDLLMILSPVRDLTDEELRKITAFTEAGGCLFLTCDTTDPVDKMPNWSALLRSYGFLPQNGMVIAAQDASGTYYNNNRTYIVPTMQSTAITEDLVSSHDTFLILAGARAFAMPTESDRGLTTTAVLTSGSTSYLRDLSSKSLSLDKQEGDAEGPFALALLAERMTSTGDMSRAFILGASTMLTSSDTYAMTVSQEFIMRAVEQLLGSQSTSLSIMAKVAVRPALSTNSIALGSFVIVLLPMMAIAIGILVLFRRKHR